jgi:hypothetical protein
VSEPHKIVVTHTVTLRMETDWPSPSYDGMTLSQALLYEKNLPLGNITDLMAWGDGRVTRESKAEAIEVETADE